MLILDIERVCREKGISNASVWLRRRGFYSSTVTAIMRKETSRLTYSQLEQMCIALHCTPNDLFSWQPDTEKTVAAGHPMYALLRKSEPSIPELLRDLPAEDIKQVRAMVIQLRNKSEGGA